MRLACPIASASTRPGRRPICTRSSGPQQAGGLALSGHVDTVPVDDQAWMSRSLHSAPGGRAALWSWRRRHEGIRRRFPRRGARFQGAQLSAPGSPVHQLRRGDRLPRRAPADQRSQRKRPDAGALRGRRAEQHEADHRPQGQAFASACRCAASRAIPASRPRGQRGSRRRRGDHLDRARSAPFRRRGTVRGGLRSAAHHHPCRHRYAAARSSTSFPSMPHFTMEWRNVPGDDYYRELERFKKYRRRRDRAGDARGRSRHRFQLSGRPA